MNFGNISRRLSGVLNVFNKRPATLAERVEAVPMPQRGDYLEFRPGVKPRIVHTDILQKGVTPVVPQRTGGVTTSATVNLNPGVTGERAPSRRPISVEEAQRRGTQLSNRQIRNTRNNQNVQVLPSQATARRRNAAAMRQQQIVGPAGYIPRVIQNHPGEIDDLGYGLINKQVR